MDSDSAPFCNQPWSTLYVHWDGSKTMPCVRGPNSLGSLANKTASEIWGDTFFQAIRRQVKGEEEINETCGSCLKDKTRCIDHIRPFKDNISGLPIEKIYNYQKTVFNYERGHVAPDNKPVVIILDISSKCHIRCPKCFIYSSDMRHHLGHMKMETFEKVVPLLKTAILVIGHENGESMLNKNFMEIVRVIKENKCRFTFNTTGLLMSPEKSRLLVEYGVEEIMLSIDSIDEERYAQLHKGGKLETVMSNIAAMKKIKQELGKTTPNLGWYFVAHKSNFKELPDIVVKAAELGIHAIYIAPLNRPTSGQYESYADFFTEQNTREDPEYAEILARSQTLAAKYGLSFRAGS